LARRFLQFTLFLAALLSFEIQYILSASVGAKQGSSASPAFGRQDNRAKQIKLLLRPYIKNGIL
jgi:hypothetical protein